MASATEFSSGKTVLILSLVIGCFAVLWPKIFYPMLQASISSTVDAPYSHVSGVYHSSILPCCHPVPFAKELNALYFTELCNRVKWRAGQRRSELQLPQEPRDDIWTPGLARWCADELTRTCGVRLDEPALERYRRAAHRRDTADAATANLTRCLETSYDLRREDIRPARLQQRQTAAKYSSQERPPGHRDAPPHVAAAAHGQAQNAARQPRRPADRMARSGGPQGMRPGMPGSGLGGHMAPQTKGSGIMGILMPIYTVGIVVFFLYTIMRVMFKPQPNKEETPQVTPPQDVKPPPAAFTGYRLQQPDIVDSPTARAAPRPAAEPLLERRTAARAAAAPPPVPTRAPRPAQTIPTPAPAAVLTTAPPAAAAAVSNGVPARGEPAALIPESPAPARQEEAEIDQLRRRLEDTEKAMERIMKQMSTVSQKLNAAKISSNIRALKQEDDVDKELWGSVDSLASDSLASDYSMSLDSRQLVTDPSWRTYSLDTAGYSRDAAPPAAGYSVDNTADVASAVSRLARSVSQLSLEMETAACDDVSLPAETGAELSELGADADDAADLVDGVAELRHDGVNATESSLASIEDDLDKAAKALKNVTARDTGAAQNGKDVHEVPPGQEGALPGSAAAGRVQTQHES